MPLQPSPAEVHVNRYLTDVSEARIYDESVFVSDKVAPVIASQTRSNLYVRYPKSYWTRAGAMLRAPNSESAGGGFKYSYGQFFCKRWSYHIDLPPEVTANQDAPIDVDRDAVLNVTQNMLLRKERLWQSTFLQTGVWGGLSFTSGGTTTNYDFAPSVGAAGGGAGSGATAGTYGYANGFWGAGSSNPIVDVTNLQLAAWNGTGVKLNTMIVTADVDAALRNNASFLARVIYGGTNATPARITNQALAGLFNVDNYYVAAAIQNTAQEGTPDVIGFMATNSALLCHVPSSPGLLTPSAMYTWSWNGLLGASAASGVRIRKFRLEHLDTMRIEGDMAYDMTVVSPDLGIYMTHLLK